MEKDTKTEGIYESPESLEILILETGAVLCASIVANDDDDEDDYDVIYNFIRGNEWEW